MTPTLKARIRGELVPVWRDGVVLDDATRARALPLVAVRAKVRVTPESDDQVAGWRSLASTVATLYAVYGIPLELDYGEEGAEELSALYGRRGDQLELGFPEPV